jgi:D-threo-aldose 1-dehydrogenase
MNPVERRTLGRSNVAVTQLGLGGGPLAGLFTEVSDDQARQTVEHAVALGIQMFDTAPLYGFGLSERRIGQALARFDRSSYVLSSKVGRILVPVDEHENISSNFWSPPRLRPIFDFSYDGVMRSLESSLERLGVDRIDILYIHDPDDHLNEVLSGAYPALEQLRSNGVVRAIGAAMNQSEMLCRFADCCDFDCFLLASRYTLLDQSALAELLPICLRRNIGVVIGGPFNSGILATGAIEGAKFEYRDASSDKLETVRQIEAVCGAFEVSLKAAALQFPVAHPAVCTVIPGCRSPRELEEVYRLAATEIPEQFWDTLRRNRLLPDDAPTPK